MARRTADEQTRVANLVAAALAKYADGDVAGAREGFADALAVAPHVEDARLVHLHRWLETPTLDGPLWAPEGDDAAVGDAAPETVGVVVNDTFDQFESLGDLGTPHPRAMPFLPPAPESAPMQELSLTSSAVQRLLEVSDDGMPGFNKPQLTPVPTLEPMRPEKSGSPDTVRGSDHDFVEIEAESTGSRTPPPVHPHSLPLPTARSTPRSPTGTVRSPTGPVPRAPTGAPARPPSGSHAPANRQAPGTLLGVMGPSLLGPGFGDEPELVAPGTSETAPDLSAVESLLGGEFAVPAPAGQEPLHRIAPNEITSVKSKPAGLTGIVEPRRKTGEARRSSSGRRTNPYLRRSPEDVAQALDDLRLAVEANAGLEAFELAERAIEILAGMPLEPEQQDLLIDAYQLAIGALDQPVRHGSVPATLDPRIAFLLSRIDGLTSVDELLEISGMPRFEAVRLLAQLVRQGVVEF